MDGNRLKLTLDDWKCRKRHWRTTEIVFELSSGQTDKQTDGAARPYKHQSNSNVPQKIETTYLSGARTLCRKKDLLIGQGHGGGKVSAAAYMYYWGDAGNKGILSLSWSQTVEDGRCRSVANDADARRYRAHIDSPRHSHQELQHLRPLCLSDTRRVVHQKHQVQRIAAVYRRHKHLSLSAHDRLLIHDNNGNIFANAEKQTLERIPPPKPQNLKFKNWSRNHDPDVNVEKVRKWYIIEFFIFQNVRVAFFFIDIWLLLLHVQRVSSIGYIRQWNMKTSCLKSAKAKNVPLTVHLMTLWVLWPFDRKHTYNNYWN